MRAKRLLIAAVGAIMFLAGCKDDPAEKGPLDGKSKLELTTEWNSTGMAEPPASYNAYVDSYNDSFSGLTNTMDNLFSPGNYTVYVSTDANGITLSPNGSTASVVTSGSNITGGLGAFYTGAQSVTLIKDKETPVTVDMFPQVVEVTLTVTPQGPYVDQIESLTATLSGIAGTMNLATNQRSNNSTVALAFADQGDGTWKATFQTLGIVESTQTLSTTISYSGGIVPEQADQNLNSKLSASFATNGSPLDALTPIAVDGLTLGQPFTEPIVTTSTEVTGLGAFGATVGGEYLAPPTVNVTEVGVEYKLASAGEGDYVEAPAGAVASPFTVTLSSLDQQTEYSYRAYVKAGVDIYYGEAGAFTTTNQVTFSAMTPSIGTLVAGEAVPAGSQITIAYSNATPDETYNFSFNANGSGISASGLSGTYPTAAGTITITLSGTLAAADNYNLVLTSDDGYDLPNDGKVPVTVTAPAFAVTEIRLISGAGLQEGEALPAGSKIEVDYINALPNAPYTFTLNDASTGILASGLTGTYSTAAGTITITLSGTPTAAGNFDLVLGMAGETLPNSGKVAVSIAQAFAISDISLVTGGILMDGQPLPSGTKLVVTYANALAGRTYNFVFDDDGSGISAISLSGIYTAVSGTVDIPLSHATTLATGTYTLNLSMADVTMPRNGDVTMTVDALAFAITNIALDLNGGVLKQNEAVPAGSKIVVSYLNATEGTYSFSFDGGTSGISVETGDLGGFFETGSGTVEIALTGTPTGSGNFELVLGLTGVTLPNEGKVGATVAAGFEVSGMALSSSTMTVGESVPSDAKVVVTYANATIDKDYSFTLTNDDHSGITSTGISGNFTQADGTLEIPLGGTLTGAAGPYSLSFELSGYYTTALSRVPVTVTDPASVLPEAEIGNLSVYSLGKLDGIYDATGTNMVATYTTPEFGQVGQRKLEYTSPAGGFIERFGYGADGTEFPEGVIAEPLLQSGTNTAANNHGIWTRRWVNAPATGSYLVFGIPMEDVAVGTIELYIAEAWTPNNGPGVWLVEWSKDGATWNATDDGTFTMSPDNKVAAKEAISVKTTISEADKIAAGGMLYYKLTPQNTGAGEKGSALQSGGVNNDVGNDGALRFRPAIVVKRLAAE